MKKLICFLLINITIVAASGCVLKKAKESATPVDPVQAVTQVSVISPNLESAAKDLLTQYFSILFNAPSVDVYTQNSRTGKIPDAILEFISEQTIREGNENPEIGIHLPRHISINGMSIIGYEVVLLGEEAVPDVRIGYVGKNGENLLFFCKIIAKAKVVPDDVFLACYEQQDDNSFIRKKDVPTSEIDGMRVEIRYDVELENKDGALKIVRAIESNIKPGLKNRLFILNNDSITRLSYLDLSLTDNGSGYKYPADGELYEREKAVIESFFTKLPVLDRERMNLLSHKWGQGLNAVKDYWDALGITKNDEGSAELINLNESFSENFPYESLPLRFDMEKVKSIQNIAVRPHPAYSDKIRWYFVNFDATVQRTNGITDEDFLYRYDYLVKLTNSEEKVIIDKIKLNEYYYVP